MTKAAQKLFVTQPSLSQSISSLEDYLGVKLFDRSKTPLETTPAGDIFVSWAKNILLSEKLMLRKLSDLSSDRYKRLIIGVSPQGSYQLLASALKRVYERVPVCFIELKEYAPDNLYSLLDKGDIDLLIGSPNPDELLYKSIPIINNKILVAAPKLYCFDIMCDGVYPSIAVAALADKPFIMLTGIDYLSKATLSLFMLINSQPLTVLKCSGIDLALMMVSKGVGVALVSELEINNKLPNINYYSLYEHPLSHSTAVIYRKDRPLTDNADRIISVFREVCSEISNTEVRDPQN